ncbi:hypothetical protein AOXY_G33330 [Acipenser oxyrinchus oxyrinchus]|uniref:Uncharacterized protein n=1 Tax=Acipenser oxyrinchus oxyrinchus TaxID=40147 RepID=A0AAD8CHP7_ACIOX|nr:hypothetical protein AOXY_G33330 [Acipenser oxyrinchus oxyrinchus]
MNPAGGVANKLWPDVENSSSVPPTWRRSFGATLTNVPAADNERRPPNRLRLKKRGVLKNHSRGGDENNIQTERDGRGAAVTPVQGSEGRGADAVRQECPSNTDGNTERDAAPNEESPREPIEESVCSKHKPNSDFLSDSGEESNSESNKNKTDFVSAYKCVSCETRSGGLQRLAVRAAGNGSGCRVNNESLQTGDSSRESCREESPCVKRNRQRFTAREHREESAFLTEDEGTDEERGTASHEHSDEEESCSDFIEDSPDAPEASPCNHGIPELFQEHGIIGLSSQSFQVHFRKAVEDLLTEAVKGNFLSQALYEKRLPGHLANAIPAEVVSKMTEEISTRLDSKLSEVFFVLSGKIDSLIRRVARTEKSIEMSVQKLRERIEDSENCGHRENVRILPIADSNPGQNAVAFF